MRGGGRIAQSQGYRSGPTEVCISPVQSVPVRWGEVIARALRRLEVWAEADDRLPACPFACLKSVAGRDEQRMAVGNDSRWSPNPAAGGAGVPCSCAMRRGKSNTNDPAMILTAISEVPAVRNVNPVTDYQERAPLILIPRNKLKPAACQCMCDIHRETG